MRGIREEEESPMFPRLHVKDADKGGGPRPPPRNKMALYEQLSIPSQRFNHAAISPASMAPCPLSTDVGSEALLVPRQTLPQNGGGSSSGVKLGGEDDGRTANEGGGSVQWHDKGMSDTSILDSDLSGFNISPDDVAGVIGPKYFWNARRAIVNQQKVFAVQVFELHRLIKVQKLIAGSPPNHCLKKKKNSNDDSSQQNGKLRPQSLKRKTSSGSQKKKNSEGIQKILPRPPQEEEEHGRSRSSDNNNNNNKSTPPPPPTCSQQPLPNGCYPGSSSMIPMMTSGATTGNQWLIPVVSPSEGLIYKPYMMGPCLPQSYNTAAGFIPPPPPVGYVPHRLPIAGDFMNPAYRINPAAICPTGFFTNPYGLVPVANNTNDSSSSIKGKNKRSKNSNNDAHNMSSTSSTSEKAPPEGMSRNGILPFKAIASTVEEDTEHTRSSTHRSDRQQAQVIKVVPHNKRSATESAARIFQSIQEERQQYE